MSEQIGKYRPAKNIKPGWHIRTLDEHGKPSWHEAALVMETFNPVTGAKAVRVACTDGVVSSCSAADEAMCRTLTEVRQADRAELDAAIAARTCTRSPIGAP